MTPTELVFFRKLENSVGDRFYVFPQMHLSSFLDGRVIRQNWKAAFYSINGKSVDYLLVEKDTMIPSIAIELDDYTHKREDRVLRDSMVNSIMEQSKMKIVHFEDVNISEDDIFARIKSVVLASS